MTDALNCSHVLRAARTLVCCPIQFVQGPVPSALDIPDIPNQKRYLLTHTIKQRGRDVDVTATLQHAGLPVVGEIQEPGFLEGGDYFAAGEDLALVGAGLRSNIEACQQLMTNNWLGTDRLGVVKDDFEQHQVGDGTACTKQQSACSHALRLSVALS